MPLWSDLEALDELFMAAGEGDQESLQSLERALAEAQPTSMDAWPETVREAWQAGLELILENIDRAELQAAALGLVHRLASAGFDTPIFRDTLAAAARNHFNHYLDPSGLLQALGAQAVDTPTTTVARRWALLDVLAPGVACWQPAHGVGTITELDGVGNEVLIQSERRGKLPLNVALLTLVAVRPGSLVERLLAKETTWDEAATLDHLEMLLSESFLSAGDQPADLFERVLVPHVVEARTLRATLGTAPGHGLSHAAAATAAENQRRWFEARSLAELNDILDAHAPIAAIPESAGALADVFGRVAARPDQATAYCEAVARLWGLVKDSEWVVGLLRPSAPEALCWNDVQLFTDLSDALAGKLVPMWFGATVAVQGQDYLIAACMRLPLRLWTHVERSLKGSGTGAAALLEAVGDALAGPDSTADQAVWLWRTQSARRQQLADANLIFRILGKPVRGAFIRARKDLYRLLMEDEAFQRLLLEDGAPDAVRRLVRCTRHLPLLDSGEQQSLLVRIVRLFPEARPLVETRQKKPGRKSVGKVTSRRSFELRRRELEDIVKVRIPANSRAIAHARGYGDLRENAEYKAAKEEQRYLTARRDELETGIHEVKATDFADVIVRNTVVPGSSVTIRDETGATRQFHVLGLWDSVPERNIVSYDTPVGKVLLGARVGDTVSLPTETTAAVIAVSPLSADLKDWVADADPQQPD